MWEKCVNWLGQGINWLGGELKLFFDLLYRKLYEFFQYIVDWIEAGIKFITAELKALWDNAAGFFKGVLQFFTDAWTWVKDCIEAGYEYVIVTLDEFYKWALDTLTTILEWSLEILYWIGETLFDWLLRLLDWNIVLCVDIIGWLIDTLPSMLLPDGFEDGLQLFLNYGSLLNEIVPFSETLSLFAMYIAFYTVVLVYRIIKSFIPLIAT